MPPIKHTSCQGCGNPLSGEQKKFCSLSCLGKHARRKQLGWESNMAHAMERDGWEIISPTSCCDRIGIKDGRVYFLEFKPQEDTRLRHFQKRVMGLVPSMYKIIAGTHEASPIPFTEASMEKRQRARKKNAASRFQGVAWDKANQKWRARICVNGTYVTVGRFRTEEGASQAREDALRKIKEPSIDGSH